MDALKYLRSNRISLKDYISGRAFPKKPYELKGSEDFMEAIKFNKINVVRQAIVINPRYLYQYDYMRQTPFHWAAKLGYDEMLKLLCQYSKRLNMYDEHRRTPLFLAALFNQKKCVEILINNGGNAFIVNDEKLRPEDVTTDDDIYLILHDLSDKPLVKMRHYKSENWF